MMKGVFCGPLQRGFSVLSRRAGEKLLCGREESLSRSRIRLGLVARDEALSLRR